MSTTINQPLHEPVERPSPSETEEWRSFFGHPAYVRFSSDILTPDRTAAEVRALQELLDLRPGTRVLDLGCGHGRISLPLARLGCAVTGLDASLPLLQRAQTAAREQDLELALLHMDMKNLDAEEAFDAVLNISTAFGYVEDERDDLRALGAVRRALAPGGRFLIDTENREYMLCKDRRIWFELGGTTVWSERSFDPIHSRWNEVIRWSEGPSAQIARFSLRLYTLNELCRMLEAAGLAVEDVWGDFDGEPYDITSQRMIVRAARAR
jgi:SAM-dependent methyltransferase